MANVRLLRQRVQDYQNAVAKVGGDYQAAYDQYSNQFANYQGNVDAYNAAVQKAWGGTRMVIPNSNGSYTLIGGTDLKGQLMTHNLDLRVADKLPELDPNNRLYADDSGNYPTTYLKNSDGSVSQYTYSPPVSDENGSRPGAWNLTTEYGLMPSMPTAPADVPTPEAPKAPNITASNARELQNPGLNPAEMAFANARGLEGRSILTGETATTNSAFADPEDPNDMASRGILARTLAGQLG